MMQLVIANPPRKRTKRKTRKKTARTRAKRRTPVARKKTSRRRSPTRRRRAPTVRRRRRSSRSSFGGTTKLLSMNTAKLAAFSTGGFIAASTLPDRFNITQLQTGYGRVAGKAIVGIVGGMIGAKMVGKANAAAFTTGALTAAGVELYAQIQAGRGVSGIGELAGTGFAGTPLLGMAGIGASFDDEFDEDMAGISGMDDDDDSFV